MWDDQRLSSAASWPCWIKDQGVALMTVLVILTVLLGLGLAALTLTLTHKDISRTEARSLQAFYAAEAGIQVALAQLAASLEWPGYDPSRGIGSLPEIADQLEGARIKEILLTPQGEVLQVEARGEAGGLTRQVAALLQKPAWAFGLVLHQATAPVSIGGNSYLRGTFIFAGDVTIGSSVQVGDSQARDGWIISGGNVVNKGVVYGGVKARGVVDNSQGTIVGVLEQRAEVFIPPVTAPDLQYYYIRADERLAEPDGEVELTGEALQAFINAGKRIV
ncbi:MAG: PilX N-terminal domain-containing pilus assembly protein, partial [Moorellales bacterium]